MFGYNQEFSSIWMNLKPLNPAQTANQLIYVRQEGTEWQVWFNSIVCYDNAAHKITFSIPNSPCAH